MKMKSNENEKCQGEIADFLPRKSSKENFIQERCWSVGYGPCSMAGKVE